MKALTLWQPWASLIALKAKRHETRSWKTDYRGPLAIHAAKRPIRGDEITTEIDAELVRQLGPGEPWRNVLPVGRILAVCELTAIFPTGQLAFDGFKAGEPSIDASEKPFGDYTPGRFAWRLENIVALDADRLPIVKGQMGLWNLDLAVAPTGYLIGTKITDAPEPALAVTPSLI